MAASGKISAVAKIAAAFVMGLFLSVMFLGRGERNVRVRTIHLPDLVNVTTTYPGALSVPSRENGLSLLMGAFNGVSLLVLIFSRPEEPGKAMRTAIRGTWIPAVSPHTYRFVIPVGSASADRRVGVPGRLLEENQMFDDMLFIAEAVTPRVTSQQLLTGLEWAMSRRFTHLLKVNEASFVDVKKILQAASKEKAPRLLWGYFRGNETIKRTGPHSESKWNLCGTFLPYPEGGGYVLSHGLVEMLTTLGPDLEHMDNDDTALGIWIAPFEDIERRHDPRFNTGIQSRGCSNQYLITHPEDASSIATKQVRLDAIGNLCEKEVKKIGGYQYNWNIQVDKCCEIKPDIP